MQAIGSPLVGMPVATLLCSQKESGYRASLVQKEKYAMGQYRIDFKTIPWDASAVGVRFKAYEQDTKKLRLAEFSKEFVEADWCTNGHIGYILEGQMEVDFDGKVIMFGPGDGVFIPAGKEHKHKGRVLTGKVKAILIEDGQAL